MEGTDGDPDVGRREWHAGEHPPKDRLDRVLATVWKDASRTSMQRAIEAGEVLVSGKRVRANSLLKPGAVVVWRPPPPAPTGLEPAAIPLSILFEDEHLVVVDKPSGMTVHPGAGTGSDTLVHALLHHCGSSLSGIGGVERPGIVHRLDRETSGAIVVAKHDEAHRRLARAFHDRRVRKIYGVLVCGTPKEDCGVMEGSIARHPVERHRMTVVRSGGRPALTHWSVRERFGRMFTWLMCDIKTGRTHQIRVHCRHANLPVLGDPVYGPRRYDALEIPPERVMLHAHELCLCHPITGAELRLFAPWPADFMRQVEQLRSLAGRRMSRK